MIAATLAAVLSFTTLLALQSGGSLTVGSPGASSQTAAPPSGSASPLAELASSHPDRRVDVIAQFHAGTEPAAAREVVRSLGGSVTRELPIIHGLGVRLSAAEAQRLSEAPAVRTISLNAAVEQEGTVNPSALATAYNQSIRSQKAWAAGHTGDGIGVAVVDTGIDGGLPDFRVSQTDPTSRVVASAVVNPAATRVGDSFGHGTHVAGLIAGNGTNRPAGDPLYGKYAGAAPDADLIDVKVADEDGNATVMDVIDGLQFVVDHKSKYNIRVVNLSLKSTEPESYRTDPLDAAVEAAWNSGIVVVVAAGNMGSAPDAVSYAPANDPYVITVGGVDDMGTKDVDDDALESWSSRGTTQDGFAKPDIVAPGARMVSTIPAGSVYTQLCPSCVTDGEYFRVGGTSMAAAVVSGEAALLVGADPTLTPNQVKAQIVRRTRAVESAKPTDNLLVDGTGTPVAVDADQFLELESAEAAVDKALNNDVTKKFNTGLTPNLLLDPVTGQIDYTRASWSRASWSDATDTLRASWSRASWSRASWSRASWSATQQSCADFERASWSRASWSSEEITMAQEQCTALLAEIDPTRASWSRASWSRASWSTSFDK
ncbi:MAG: S8 family peptidase [Actinomycetota bacterium]